MSLMGLVSTPYFAVMLRSLTAHTFGLLYIKEDLPHLNVL